MTIKETVDAVLKLAEILIACIWPTTLMILSSQMSGVSKTDLIVQ